MVKMQYTTTNKFNTFTIFAADYDCNAYGAGTYNNTDCVTGTPGTSNPGGSLSDTGYNIILPVALALALILAAIILLVKRMRRHKQSQQ